MTTRSTHEPARSAVRRGARLDLLRAILLVLRRPAGGGAAVPGERHPRSRHSPRAAGRGRRALLPVRGQEPDQRSVSHAAGRAEERAVARAGWTSRCSGATATPSRSSTPRCAAIEAAGHRRVLAVVTSAYPSYSSCRQYRENLYDAASGTTVEIDRIRHYAEPPGLRRGVGGRGRRPRWTARHRGGRAARLVFVTHSIPTRDGRAPPARSRAAPTARTSTGTAWSPPR